MKKRIEKISQKAVTYLLLLTYILLLIPTSTVSAASSSETTLPTVSLTWAEGTTLLDGAAVPSSGSLTAVVTVTGTVAMPVTVTVQSFDVSAKKDTDYTSVSQTLTFNAAGTQTVSVSVKNQENAMKIGESVYSKLFGLTITSSVNATPAEQNTIFARIGSTSTLTLVKNKEAANGSGEGYAHEDAGRLASNKISFYSQKDTTTPKESFNLVYHGSNSPDNDPWALTDFTKDTILNEYMSAAQRSLIGFYEDEDLVWLNAMWYETDPNLDISEKYTLQATLCKMPNYGMPYYYVGRYYDDIDWSDPFNLIYPSDTPAESSQFHEQVISTGYSILTLGKSRGEPEGHNGVFFNIKNEDDFRLEFQTFRKANLNNATGTVTLISTTKPAITDYRLVLSPSYAGGMLCVAVDFSKPVQFLNGGKDNLRLSVELGGQTVSLKYLGGEYTSTLLFGLSLDESDVSTADSIKVKGLTGSFGVTIIDDMIADLLWNEKNKNNTWDSSSGSSETFDVDTDLRTPSISIDSCDTKNDTLTAHTVNVKIQNMAAPEEGSSVYYAWDKNADIDADTKWIEKTDFVIGSNAFTHAGVTGDYYLHVKAEGANQISTYWTYGSLAFDNDPKIKNVYSETEGVEAQEHSITMSITDATSVSYAWSTSSDHNSVSSWTNKTDFAVGENTFVGRGYHHGFR